MKCIPDGPFFTRTLRTTPAYDISPCSLYLSSKISLAKEMVEVLVDHFKQIGISDEDAEQSRRFAGLGLVLGFRV